MYICIESRKRKLADKSSNTFLLHSRDTILILLFVIRQQKQPKISSRFFSEPLKSLINKR